MSDENKQDCGDDGCKPTKKCGCSSMSKQTSSGKQAGLGTYIGVLIIILAAAVGAHSLKNGNKQKECDTESGCCPAPESKVVEEAPAPAESTPGCCPSPNAKVVEKAPADSAAGCCPSTDAPVVEKEEAPAAGCGRVFRTSARAERRR